VRVRLNNCIRSIPERNCRFVWIVCNDIDADLRIEYIQDIFHFPLFNSIHTISHIFVLRVSSRPCKFIQDNQFEFKQARVLCYTIIIIAVFYHCCICGICCILHGGTNTISVKGTTRYRRCRIRVVQTLVGIACLFAF
jgi:hypothetical protein